MFTGRDDGLRRFAQDLAIGTAEVVAGRRIRGLLADVISVEHGLHFGPSAGGTYSGWVTGGFRCVCVQTIHDRVCVGYCELAWKA
ncbi:unnamed protein product [Ectocarpus sp. 13 AM-2016]